MGWFEDEREWEMAKMDMNDILRKKYPADRVNLIASNGKHIGHLLASFAPIPKPSLLKRIATRIDGWRFKLGCWIAGAYLDDEDDSCD